MHPKIFVHRCRDAERDNLPPADRPLSMDSYRSLSPEGRRIWQSRYDLRIWQEKQMEQVLSGELPDNYVTPQFLNICRKHAAGRLRIAPLDEPKPEGE